MKQARAYSGALDQRDEQTRMQTQQRAQTIRSMQTKKYELDERKMGFSQPRMKSVSQPKTQYVSALPILDTAHSVVNPVLNQNNPLRSSFQTAMPNASMMQQATNNFQQWNKQYEQDENLYIDAVDRVASLAGWGAPPDEKANRQLEESEAKLNQTKEQEDSMLRQTLTMLGPGAEEIIKAAYKDATDHPGAGYKVQYTQEETARRAQNQKRAQELKNRIGADLYGKLYNYVYEQDTAAKAAKKQREEAEAAARRRHRLEAKYYTLSSVSASKDFEEKSQYHSTAKDGVRPRDWGKVLGSYIYENLAGAELTMYDEYGNPETVYLARENDRVKKDGANRPHKVLDKLARYQGNNIRTLATVHLSEALETSKDAGYLNEHSHQWMDQNGWNYRKAYLQDRNGNIYEATLNIADGRDRRILYDINNIKKIDKAKATGGVVPSTKNGRGSLTNSDFENSIPENTEFGKREL